MTRRFQLCALLLLSTAACGDKAQPAADSPPSAPAPAPQAAPAPKPSSSAPPAPSGQATAGGLSWQDAAPFVRRAPKSSMRAAEYGVSGDDKTELTVFYFGPDQGGSVDANITRWL